ncbi:MAG: hypothetical protein E7641_08200 [Ruminococcaceae bacterium]|nr:hypothetical protein [Oscillospiraceae bacterium]
MKKALLLMVFLLSSVTLCSCKANWFGETIDVPWYFIVIPVFAVFAVSYVILIGRKYVCPECNAEFKPKWYQISVIFHLNGKRVVKCPRCGRKGFCERKK